MKLDTTLRNARTFCAAAMLAAQTAYALSPPVVPPMAKMAAAFVPLRMLSPGAAIPIRLDSVAVTTRIAGRIAQTSVELVFHNPNARVLEGELQFPLLDGQEVTGFAMDFDGRLRDAVPIEKARGQALFEDITRQRVDPALAEKTVGNNFKLRVYPLNPGATKVVVVRYQEPLAVGAGQSLYRLPLVFGERVARFVWSAQVAGGAAPRHVRGPLADAAITRTGGGYALYAEKRDVVLAGIAEFAIAAGGAPVASVQEFNGTTYFYAGASVGAHVGLRGIARPAPSRVALYWDASGSGALRDHAREFALLGAYFQRFRDVEVALVSFRDVPEPAQRFKVAGGDWAALRGVLEAMVYDGASNVGALPPAAADEALLFSDGLANYGETGLPRLATRVYAMNAAARADTGFLRALADRSGGRFIDLTRATRDAAAAQLLDAPVRVSIEGSRGVADVMLASPYALAGQVALAGRLTEARGAVVLKVEAPGVKVMRVTVPVGAPDAGSARPDAVVPPHFAAAQWARLKVAQLEAEYDLNRAEVERLGKTFGLITRGTSLIILDTAADYARHGVEPPADLRAEYERVRGTVVRAREVDRSAHLERVVRLFQEKQAWWEREFPKGDRPVAVLEKRAEAVRERQSNRADAAADMRVAPAAPAPAIAAQRSAAKAAGPADAPAQSLAAGSVGSAKEKAEKAASNAIAIRLQPWAPDSPYARRLREAEASQVYRIYLDERASHAASTAFFLDVADLLMSKGEKALALRVLSNLAEMDLENRHILRVLGYRLLQAGEPATAVAVFRKVRELSPDEPQSHRDLGLAYAAAGQTQRAVDALIEVVTRPWHGRFPDVELITLAELNAVIATASARPDLSRIDPRLIRNLPLDLRAVLTWDADNTDIDLWVTDPNGEKAFYGHRLTHQGGRMSADFTGGYGPEEFSLRSAKPGKYRIQAQFYGHRQQIVAGATTLQVRLATRFGTPAAKEQLITLRLKGGGETVFVGEFEVGDGS